MDTYKLTFVNNIEDSIIVEFEENEINRFDINFDNKFALEHPYLNQYLMEEELQAFCNLNIDFIAKEENFEKLKNFFYSLKNIENISEVLVYKNDNLIGDLKNIINISSRTNLLNEESVFNLNICEGM